MKLIDKDKVLAAIPDNWLDPLLTGPHKALPDSGPYTPNDIERLMHRLRERLALIPETNND